MADVSRSLAPQHETALTTNVRQARIARVYAESLIAVAARENQVDDAGAELDAFVTGVLGRGGRVAGFFTSPAITRKQRAPILEAALRGTASPLVANFLRVLNHNNRLELLPAIDAAYRELVDERAGRVRVLVRSAVELDSAKQDEIRGLLASSLNKEPVLRVRVEPELLGGLIVQVGDKVYDSSVRSRLDALRNQLTSRGSNVVKA
jgi:F-type H+-transporting ATPase subunit delta